MTKTLLYCLSILFFLSAGYLINARSENKEAGNEKEQQVSRGKQLVSEGNCNFCHTPYIETKEGPVPDPERILAGHPEELEIPSLPDADLDSEEWLRFLSSLDQTVWAGPWGLSFAANLTPDAKTGIGKWNEEIFIETMRSGKHVSLKRDILPPMPWEDYAKLNDRDLKAIFAYLMTLDPVENAVPRPAKFIDDKSSR